MWIGSFRSPTHWKVLVDGAKLARQWLLVLPLKVWCMKEWKGDTKGASMWDGMLREGIFCAIGWYIWNSFLQTYVHFGLPRDQEGFRSSYDKKDERIFLEIMFSRIFWWSWCASELDRNLAKEPLLYHKQIRRCAWKVTPKDSSIGWTVDICHRFFCVTSSNFLASIHIAT